MLDEQLHANTHQLAITELRYVLCRNIGKEKAEARVEKLLASGYLPVHSIYSQTEA